MIVNTRTRDGSVVILKDGEAFIAPSSPRSAGDDSPRSIVVVSQHSPRDEQGGDENDTLIGGDEANGRETEEDDAGGRVEELTMEEIDERLEKGEDSTKVHSVFGLVALVFFLVCGGAYGTEDLGGSIPPLYALTGILIIPWIWSLPMAMMTAELASAMPSHSGFILWGRQAWGPIIPFVDGWIMMVVAIVDQALYPLIFVDYLKEVVSLNAWQAYLVCVVYIGLACFLNVLGPKIIDKTSQFFSLSSLFPFVLFIILALFSSHFSFATLVDTSDRKSDVGLYLSVLIWATCGYEYSGFLAGNVKDPKRTYPLAMVLSVVLMLVTYLFPIATAIATAKDWSTDISQGSYPILAEELGFGSWLLYMMIAGGLVSTMGTYNAYLHTSSTALHSLSKDEMAPSVFQYESERFGTPVAAIAFFSLTTCVLVLFDFSYLVEVESFLYATHALLLCSTFIRLAFTQPHLNIPSILPFGRTGVLVCGLTPLVVLVAIVASLFYSDFRIPLVGALIAGMGPLLYVAQTKMPSLRHLVADRCYYRYFAVRQM